MSGTKEQENLRKELEEVDNHPQVTINDDGTKTVTLEEPVEYAQKEIQTLTFHVPRGKDWLATDEAEGDVGKGFALAASTAKVPSLVFGRMLGTDAMLCARVAGSMGKKLETGDK
jgi:hypothetical protein